MFTTLYIRELQNYLYSLRLHVSFAIVLLVFVIGSISFVSSFKEVQGKYTQYRQTEQTKLAEQAENISNVATKHRSYLVAPRSNSVLTDCKENYLPNQITYSAYNVFGFSVQQALVNPLLNKSESLSWGFIVSMFLSFITLLFAFDAISGEKEDHTLALVFSNPVPRRTYLGSKLAAIITVVGCMVIIGIMISLFILIVSGEILIDGTLLLEVVGFILISLLLITVFAVFGLFSSVVTRYSNVSLLISLCFWLAIAVVIPNTSVFWAKKLFPIPTADVIETKVSEASHDLAKNAPKGSWSSNGSNPFFDRHELRANVQMKLMNSEKELRDAYYQQMFHQFESTRGFTLISPIAQFDYINEAFLGGGYLRFQKNWTDLHIFQPQFLQWFKNIDAKDKDTPHWYNPYEDYSTSKKPVEVDQIPQYHEQIAPFAQRIQFVSVYLIAMLITIALLFGACFCFFVRYDVR